MAPELAKQIREIKQVLDEMKLQSEVPATQASRVRSGTRPEGRAPVGARETMYEKWRHRFSEAKGFDEREALLEKARAALHGDRKPPVDTDWERRIGQDRSRSVRQTAEEEELSPARVQRLRKKYAGHISIAVSGGIRVRTDPPEYGISVHLEENDTTLTRRTAPRTQKPPR